MRIFYGLAGDGLGHASRTLAILEHLPSNIEIHLFTFGQAYDFYKKLNYPFLHKINGITWHNRNNKISLLKTAWKGKKLILGNWKTNIKTICEKASLLGTDLFISDFEPSIARAAHKMKKPLLSIDNQHRFSHCYKKGLTLSLKIYSSIMGLATNFIVPNPEKIMISTFHNDLLQTSKDNVILVDGIVRKQIEKQKVSDENFILVYAREGFGELIVKHLKGFDNYNFKIYGLNKPNTDNFQFYPLSNQFTEDLARCTKVISPSGNQLITETKYYGKPVLTIPQANQWEQYINAFYIEKMGLGKYCHVNKLNYHVIKEFLEDFNPNIKGFGSNGVHKVVEVIQSYL